MNPQRTVFPSISVSSPARNEPKPNRAAGFTNSVKAPLLVAALILGATTGNAQTLGAQLLVDPGLNSGSAPLIGYNVGNMFSRWQQEAASLVTGQQPLDLISPQEGDGMIKLVSAGGSATQVRQRIDVTALATQIDAGGVTADVTGWVNASVAGVSGGTLIASYDAIQGSQAFSGVTLFTDGDPLTWEFSSASMILPIGTRYVEFQFAFTNISLPSGDAVYGDAATLILTGPTPSCPVGLFPDFCNGDGGNQLGCTDCPCGNNAPGGTIGGCINSVGSSARLVGTGDPSVSIPAGSSTDLRFAVCGAIPNVTCVLKSGDALAPTGQANPCFGLGSGVQSFAFDGLRCAVMNAKNIGARTSDSFGNVGFGTSPPWGGEAGPNIGIAAQGGFAAGHTRYFQAVYREDPTTVCQTGLNTTQAVEVTFIP